MRILLVGGGGREHALAWAITRHGHALSCTHANPGFERLGARLMSPALDPVDIARTQNIELVVIGPEAPLTEGLVDRLVAAGIPAFGPTAAAARLEASKLHTKRFCLRHGLPTAGSQVLAPGQAPAELGPAVVKLDGLAAGTGVWVCDDAAATTRALAEARAQRPGEHILLEERLEGPEVSLLGISDGERVVALAPARDHKRRFDGDSGPNTGGMGAIAPIEFADRDECVRILERAVAGAAADGVPFRGVLYGGFMLTPTGPKLLEFNVRFGDPECQPLMTLLDEDPVPWFFGSATGRLPGTTLRWRPGYACCVVVSAATYPRRGADTVVHALPEDTDDLHVFHAGTKRVAGVLRASGGRVFGVTGRGATPAEAVARAYAGVGEVKFSGADWRRDIGAAPWR